MSGSHSKRVSAVLSALALFLIYPVLDAAEVSERNKSQQHATAMVEAGRKMVMHINTAARSGDLSEIHVHAKESVRLGEELLMHAKAALEDVQWVVEILELQANEVQDHGEQAIFHLKETIKHGKSALMHARHATRSKGLRGGLSHVRESAKHARISALYALEGEYLVQGL